MSTSRPTIRLDDRDIRMLAILQREGRIAKVTLAERVNLSPTPCWERLRRLEQAGIVEGYGARVSLRALGPVAIVFVQIEIGSHRKEDFARFEQSIGEVPEIVECWGIGGGMDYLCKVMVRHLADYQELIEGLLSREIGIKRYYSYVVTAPVKNAPAPISRLVSVS